MGLWMLDGAPKQACVLHMTSTKQQQSVQNESVGQWLD